MKKNLVLMVLLLGMISFNSCSQQEEPVNYHRNICNRNSLEMEKLIHALDSFNNCYFENTPMVSEEIPVTRSIGSWFKKLRHITCADAVGGIIGSLFGPWGTVSGATLFSSVVFCAEEAHLVEDGLTRANIEDEPEDPDDRLITLNSDALEYTVLPSILTMCNDSVGYYHNAILTNLYENDLLDLSPLTFDTMVNSICNQAEESFSGRGNTTSSQLKDSLKIAQFNFFYQSTGWDYSLHDYILQLKMMYSEYTYELDFMESYIEALCLLDQAENNGTYATGVLSIINNSNVDDSTKKRLGEAVITGNASAKLWNYE